MFTIGEGGQRDNQRRSRKKKKTEEEEEKGGGADQNATVSVMHLSFSRSADVLMMQAS